MAEASSSTTPTVESNGSSKDKRKKGGLITFIKKNKTLSAVAGVGGLYFLYKMNTEKSGNSGEPEGEVSEIFNESGALAGTAQAAAFELGRSERLAEQSRSEVEEIEAEREDERRRVKEKGKEKEEEETPGGESPGAGGGGTTGGEAEPTNPGGGSVTIHGRTFSDARSSHIAKTGKTSGGKAYVEYAIQFAGRIEHWQYFTATGNWRRVADSSSGGGANKPGPGTSPSPDHHPAGGPATGSNKNTRPKTGVGQNKPVSTPAPAPKPPSTNPVHPQAVNTGNRCVNGGVGGHTAPPGYRLFCQNGWIWRVPN